MMLWLAIAALAAGVTAWVTRPLWRATADVAAADEDPAARIYIDQLAEIDADAARGLIGPAEAEAARAEVGRRLLAHHALRSTDVASRTGRELSPRVGFAGAALGLLLAVALYGAQGRPTLPDQPFEARTDGAPQQAAAIRAFEQLEDHLADHPSDGQGWERIAPVYMRLGRYEAAADAFERAMTLEGRTVPRLTGLVKARIFLNEGRVDAPARRALEEVVALEPGNLDNRFWLAVAREQAGEVSVALDDYRQLLKAGDPKAPWRPLAAQRLAAAEARLSTAGPRVAGVAPSPSAPPAGPAPGMPQLSQDQLDAAKQMSAGDRLAMIEQMVGRLADRLKTNAQDSEGWQRLVQAYVVLGRKADATAALGEARRQLAADRDALGKLDQLAQRLGLGS